MKFNDNSKNIDLKKIIKFYTEKNMNNEKNENNKKNENIENDDLFKKNPILFLQKKFLGNEKLVKRFPCCTIDVTNYNPFFGKRISFKSKKQIQNFLKEYKYDFFSIIKDADCELEVNDTKTKIEVVIQSRGNGKTHLALSYAITDNNIVIYIDMSTLNERFRDNAVSSCINELENLQNDNIDERAQEAFLKTFFVKIIFFLTFYELFKNVCYFYFFFNFFLYIFFNFFLLRNTKWKILIFLIF